MKLKIFIVLIVIAILIIIIGLFVYKNSSIPEINKWVEEKGENSNEIIEIPSFIPDIINNGDLVISGEEVKIIDSKKYFQQGNIYVKDNAKLIIKNSEFMIGRGDISTIHVYTFVDKNASLEIENSYLFS